MARSAALQSSSHNLEWALRLTHEEASTNNNAEETINANIRLLGRYGVVSVTWVGPPEKYASTKRALDDVISRFQYKEGKRYGDFVPGQDQVAEIGLTALVAGGLGAAAVKTGFFAKFILPILLMLKKLILLIVAGILGLFTGLKNKLFPPKVKNTDKPSL